jgi:hypothetical protein
MRSCFFIGVDTFSRRPATFGGNIKSLPIKNLMGGKGNGTRENGSRFIKIYIPVRRHDGYRGADQ